MSFVTYLFLSLLFDSGVASEVSVLKSKVRRSYVQSWSVALELYEVTEGTLMDACDIAIDRVVCLLSDKTIIHVYDVISDLIQSARNHLSVYANHKYLSMSVSVV